MFGGWARQLPAAPRPRQKPNLQQVRLDDIFERSRIFVQRRRDGFEADGAAFVGGGDGAEVGAVEVIQAEVVYGFEFERGLDARGCDGALGFDLGVVADAAEEAVGDSGCAAGAGGDEAQGFITGVLDVQEGATAAEDGEELFGGVVLEVVDDAEARSEGGREKTGAGRGADQCEGLAGDLDGAGVDAAVEEDVDSKIFHRGVDELFDRDGEAVDFVDEKDIAAAEAFERCDQVGGACEGGAAGDADFAAHFVGDDVGEGGFAQARGAVEENVLHRIAAAFTGVDGDLEALDEVGLADVVGDLGGAKGPVDLFLFGGGCGRG